MAPREAKRELSEPKAGGDSERHPHSVFCVDADSPIGKALSAAVARTKALRDNAKAAPEEAQQGALALACEVTRVLNALGWNVSMSPPKDRPFLTVEPGSTGVHKAQWSSDGHCFFVESDGDLYPMVGLLAWREIPK